MASYLLSFTLLITSVIKMADVFLKTDRALTKERQQFIHLTKKVHQRGSLTLPGALFLLLFSSLLCFFALKYKVELKEARYRKNAYLCFHYLNEETRAYVTEMARFNWPLRSAFAAMVSGTGGPSAKVVFESLRHLRNAKHFYYLKKLQFNRYCPSSTASLSYMANTPFKIVLPSMKLLTAADESTLMRTPQWTTFLYLPPAGIRVQNSFSLTAKWTMEGAFIPRLKVQTAEVSKVGFSKLNSPFGFL